MQTKSKSDRHFGLFVYLGIELRNFVFSGLSARLAEIGEVSILTNQRCQTLEEAGAQNNINIIDIPGSCILNKERRRLESFFLSSRRARIRIKNGEVFNLWHDSIKLRKKDFLIGNIFVYKIFQTASSLDNRIYYYDATIADLIKQNYITDIILQGYFTQQNMIIAITAKKLGCRIWVINWSWKDFYINEYIPFKPDGFFTWSQKLKKLYAKHNSHIKPGKILAIGNLSYDKMFNYKPEKPLSYYTAKYRFSSSSDIFIYTMVHPRIFPDEQLLAREISDLLYKNGIDAVILMKPNPMDVDWERFRNVEENGRLIMLENLWHYDDRADFNMITEEGQREWLDLIFYSKANISVASTVTIENLIMKRPVINILFDNEGELQKEFVRLFEAPFYRICNERDDVIGCRNIIEVIEAIANLKNINGSQPSIDDLMAGEGRSLEAFIKTIKHCE